MSLRGQMVNRLLVAVLISCTAALGETEPAVEAQDPKPLTGSAAEAVALAKYWNDGGGVPSPVSIDQVGRVKYAYGSDMPTLVCAPLRVCTLELEAGELVTGDLQVGDPVRWTFSLMAYGGAGGSIPLTPVIVLKPTPVARETNLLVTTDRRVYYVRLVAQTENYMARVSFSYPADDAAKWRRDVKVSEPPPAPVPLPAPTINRDDVVREVVENLNFNYAWKGGRKTPCIKPSKVFDDGVHTVIQMPACVSSRELPVLLVHADGKDIVTNYRFVDGKFIVDRLFEQAALRAGGSRAAVKDAVRIERGKVVTNGRTD